MTFYKYGASALEKPINDVLQRWRISLASLLFFTIFLTDNFGLSTSGSEYHKKDSCNLSITQCLETKRNLTSKICIEGSVSSSSSSAGGSGKDSRASRMRNMRLPFCSMFFVYNVIDKECKDSIIQGTIDECRQCIHNLQNKDIEAFVHYQQFESIMSRFDCSRNYSTHASCINCKERYKNWLCTTSIPYYLIDDQKDKHEKLAPCRDFCEEVESQCPYFLPEVDQQYAGEPSFLCMDRSISSDSLQQNFSCYYPCWLSLDSTCSSRSQSKTRKKTCIIHPDNTSSNFTCGALSSSASVLYHDKNKSRCLVAQLTLLVWLINTSLVYLCIGLT